MCNALKDGGQRCYAHAKQALDAALARYDKPTLTDVSERRAALRRRLVDFATTERGREEIAQDRRLDNPGPHRFGAFTGWDLDRIVEEGRLLEERNKAIADISKAERRERSVDKAKRLVKALKVPGYGTVLTGALVGSAAAQPTALSIAGATVVAAATAADTARAVARARHSARWGERRVETEAREEVSREAREIVADRWRTKGFRPPLN